MLIQFRVANYRSFKEEQVLDLLSSSDNAHPDSVITGEAGGREIRCLRSAALFGANASGKSNLIRALSAMRSLIARSATKMTHGDHIRDTEPFRLAAATMHEPSLFEITFDHAGGLYIYGFEATSTTVCSEWLDVKPAGGGRKRRWMDRRLQAGEDRATWSFDGPLQAVGVRLSEMTRSNGLFLSLAAQQNQRELSELFLWCRKGLRILDLSQQPFNLYEETASRAKDDPRFACRVEELVRHADMGIVGMHIVEQSPFVDMDSIPPEMRSFFTRTGLRKMRKVTGGLRVESLHAAPGFDDEIGFDLMSDESNGTKRFFSIAGPFLETIDTGGVLIVDELECSMHPMLTRKLIELFQSPNVNKKGAQLIFATHDVTLMDPTLFRRDQIWLAEKNEEGASELFSLWDIEEKPRKGERFDRNYLAGRYGGVPNFGPTFEDLEIAAE